jgi:antitoxin YefM
MSLDKYNDMMRTARNADYLDMIDRSMAQIIQGRVVVKTIEELEALANG